MNQIVAFHGLAAYGRLDVRAMVKHFTQPFESAVPFEAVIDVVRRNSTPTRRSKSERKSAAIEIRRAVAGHTIAIRKAMHDLGITMLAPDEEDVRRVIGVMLGTFHARPTATSEHFCDTLTMELMAADVHRPFALPAIMAAAREMWCTLPSPPSIADVLKAVREHQRRLDVVFKQLGDVLEASDWADDLIEPDKPVEWDESDPDFIPF